MNKVQREISIEASAECVFAYLADFNRHREWAGHELEFEQTSSGPLGPGTTFKLVSPSFSRGQVSDLAIIEFLANEHIIMETDGADGRLRHSFLLRELGGITHLTKIAELVWLPWRRKLVRPLLTSLVFPHILAGQLRRIRKRCTQGS